MNHNYYRAKKAQEILSEYNIEQDILTYVRRVTDSFVYHNIQHIYSVIINLYNMFDFNALSFADQRLLIIAALFHDADYKGFKDDDKNIERSISFFRFIMENHLTPEEKDIVSNYISTTNAKNIFITNENKGLASLLQDADICTNFEPDAEYFWNGLSKEMNTKVNLESTVAFLEKYPVKNENNEMFFKYEIEKLKEKL